jgi:hypothetical protein
MSKLLGVALCLLSVCGLLEANPNHMHIVVEEAQSTTEAESTIIKLNETLWDTPAGHGSRPPADSPFRVAVVTAGGLRSFAVAFQSWKRYILDPWEGHVFLFAAVTGHRSCEMSSIGMRLLEGAATDLEVSYSSTPSNNALHPKRSEDRKRVMCDRLTASNSQKAAGGASDMFATRARAYDLAINYAKAEKIHWDLVLFIRPDLAFYGPVFQFYRYYSILKHRKHISGRREVIIPRACNFGGYCDRLAVGLGPEMTAYFQNDFIGVLDTMVKGSEQYTRFASVADFCPSSERLLRGWLYGYNNISALSADSTMSVFTLRQKYAESYCSFGWGETVKQFLSHWTDLMTSFTEHGAHLPSAEDLLHDPILRCGDMFLQNITRMCQSPLCFCEANNGGMRR